MRSRPRGLSLVEVIVSVGLLAVASLAAVSILPATFSAERRAERTELASMAAFEIMQSTVTKPFDTIVSTSGSYPMTMIMDGLSQTLSYTYTLTVVSLSSTLKDLTVTVNWQSQNAAKSVVLETRLYGGIGTVGVQ